MVGWLDSKQNGRGGRFIAGRLNPQRGRGTQGRRNPGIPRRVPLPTGGGRTGAWGGGGKNPPTAQATREQQPDGGDGAAQRGGTESPDEAMEMAAGASREGYPPKHCNGASGATAENSKHPRREYEKVASEASARGQASAGPAAGEDGHGATTHSAGHLQEERGDENSRRASLEREPDNRETEERGTPERHT